MFNLTWHVSPLPNSDLTACFVEKTFVIPQSDFARRLRIERFPQTVVLTKDFQILGLILRRGCVRAKQKAIRIAFDQIGQPLGRVRVGDKIFGNFVPRNIEVNVMKVLIPQDRFDLRKIPLGGATKRPKPI